MGKWARSVSVGATVMAIATVLALAATAAGSAATATEPMPAATPSLDTVTIESGPTTTTSVLPECSDAAMHIETADRFVITRSGATGPIDISYAASGRAVAGTDYTPLSGLIAMPTGTLSVEVPITAGLSERSTYSTDLTITLAPSSGYAIGSPSSTTLQFVVRRDRSLGSLDCNPDFQLVDVTTNREQTIRVGETPRRIETTFQNDGYLTVVGGTLPPGIRVKPINTSPGFDGIATAVGGYSSRLRVCPPLQETFTCHETTLTIHVLAKVPTKVTPSTLPSTGALSDLLTLIGSTTLLLGLGTALLLRRRTC